MEKENNITLHNNNHNAVRTN